MHDRSGTSTCLGYGRGELAGHVGEGGGDDQGVTHRVHDPIGPAELVEKATRFSPIGRLSGLPVFRIRIQESSRPGSGLRFLAGTGSMNTDQKDCIPDCGLNKVRRADLGERPSRELFSLEKDTHFFLFNTPMLFVLFNKNLAHALYTI